MIGLPSLEDYKKMDRSGEEIDGHWDKELFRCPECNGGVKRDYSTQYMTDPPKFRYFCKECGFVIIM